MTTKETISAVIYTRVSSKQQALHGNGLKGQEFVVREYAEKEWISIVKLFSDGGISGKYTSREGLEEMLLELNKWNKLFVKIQYVLVDDIDRLMRDVAGWREVKGRIEATWAKIHSLKQDLDDTPEWKMLQSITMSTKQYERENGARRTRERQRSRMEMWYRSFNVPTGYKYQDDPSGKGRIVVPNEHLPAMKEWFEKFAEGILLNKAQLTKFWQDNGVRTRYGNPFKLNSVNEALKRKNLLFYAGIIHYPDRDIHMKKAKHEAIISVATVEQILKKINPKEYYKDYTQSDIQHRLILRGILKCEFCGRPIGGSPSKGRKEKYYYYHCNNKSCSTYRRVKGLKAEDVHMSLENFLDELELKESWLTSLSVIVKKFSKDKMMRHKKVQGQIKEKYSAISKQLEKVESLLIDAENSRLIEVYEKKMINLLEQKAKLESNLSQDLKEEPYTIHLAKVSRLITNPRKARRESSDELRRLMVKTLFPKGISYNRKSGIRTTEIPLLYRYNEAIKAIESNNLGIGGLEPPTSPLSEVRSNQLSYMPNQLSGTRDSNPRLSSIISGCPNHYNARNHKILYIPYIFTFSWV